MYKQENDINMDKIKDFKRDSRGDAVVEASILFPIIIMAFAALVLLSAYLPTRAALQRATQYAATALATEYSDAWLFFDLGSMNYYWERDKDRLGNVYSSIFVDTDGLSERAEKIVKDLDLRLPTLREGELSAEGKMNNSLIYREIEVTATRIFTPPINLSFIGFPEVIELTVTSTAAIQNGDEFVRNVDIAIDFADYIATKFGYSDAGDAIGSLGSRFKSIIGG